MFVLFSMRLIIATAVRLGTYKIITIREMTNVFDMTMWQGERKKKQKKPRLVDHRHDCLFTCLFISNCRGVFVRPKMFYPHKSDRI